MRILLDTCAFLWIVTAAPELSKTARDHFQDPDNDVFLSAVSIWEIIVKHDLGKAPLPEEPSILVPRLQRQHEIESLPLEESAVLQLSRLPKLHRDPFDRMLVCQAIVEGMTLLTPDSAISQYPVPVGW